MNRFVDRNATIFIEVGVNISGATVGTIALSSLSGADGFVLNGIDAADYSGKRVSAAGDFNGDGFDDFLISADYANSSAGESYVVSAVPILDRPPALTFPTSTAPTDLS